MIRACVGNCCTMYSKYGEGHKVGRRAHNWKWVVSLKLDGVVGGDDGWSLIVGEDENRNAAVGISSVRSGIGRQERGWNFSRCDCKVSNKVKHIGWKI